VRLPFGRGAGAVAVTASPATLLPTAELTATITIREAIERVAGARAELGYVNTYLYRWAGRADAAATAGADSLATIGDVGTDYGSARETGDWVSVIACELELAPGGTLAAGTRELAFRVPSWAPGSSPELVGWAVRLTVDRRGRDIEEAAQIVVLAPAPGAPETGELERVMGGSADIDIRLDRPAWRAGETIRGTLVISAPAAGLPAADVAVVAQFDRLSHPLERTPAPAVTFERARRQLGKRIQLGPGRATEVPFELDLPADVPPTAEAVHGSLTWFVGVRILYAGFGGPLPERVRRGIAVYNG